jgi:hypothetical protein
VKRQALNATRTVLNVQPVVPFTLTDDCNLIGRRISFVLILARRV